MVDLSALPLGDQFDHCLARLSHLPAAQLGAAFDALVRPMSVCGSPAPGLPALAALPLAAQANLLLLLRAAPHRFTSSQHAAMVASVAQLAAIGASGAGLLQLLACDVSGEAIHAAVPPCPDFLFTPEPCLLWAPVLADDQAATALQGQLAAARGQQCQDGTEGEDAVGSAKRHAEGQAVPGGSSKRPRQAAACADPLTDQSAADAELAAAVQAVRHALAAHASGGGGELRCIPAELQAALGTLALRAAAGTAAGAAALQASGLASLEDDSLLLLLLQELVSPTSSYARCSVAAGAVLLPRLQGLLGAAPRDLAAAVEHVATSNPQAFIAACLKPLLSSPSGLSKHQAEVVGNAVKSALPAQLLPEVLVAACSAAPGTAAGSAWNEHVVGVLQAALNVKPALSAAVAAQLAGALQSACSSSVELAASAKLAKLALTLVKQYAAEAATAKAALQQVAAACTSFIAKSLAAAVSKL